MTPAQIAAYVFTGLVVTGYYMHDLKTPPDLFAVVILVVFWPVFLALGVGYELNRILNK